MASFSDEEDSYILSSYDTISASTSQLPFFTSTTKVRLGSSVQKLDRQIAVVTHQGNGIHLFNLLDQTPVNSFTLGPSIKFQTPAYCRSISNPKGKEKEGTIETLNKSPQTRIRETWISIKAKDATHSSELRKWFGKERTDGRTDDDLEFLSKEYEDRILDLEPSTDLEEFTFVAHESGKIRVVNNDIEDVILLDTLNGCDACRLQSIGQAQCSFLSDLPPSSTLLYALLFTRSKSSDINSKKKRKSKGPVSDFGSFRVQLALILFTSPTSNSVPALQLIGTLDLGEDLVDVSLETASGFLSTIDENGMWQTFQLSALPSESLLPKMTLKPLKQLYLANLILRSSNDRILLPQHLLSVGSSFVLLVAPSTASNQLKVLLWDLKYGVVITETLLPSPSTSVTVALAQVGPNSISISLTPLHSERQTTQSTYYIVSIPIPSQSALAPVLDHYSITEPYLQSRSQFAPNERIFNPLSSTAKVSLLQSGDTSRKELLQKLKGLSNKKEWEKMWETFKEWEKAESARLKEHEEIRIEMRRRAVNKGKQSLSGANLVPIGANRMALESVSRTGSESLAHDEEMEKEEGSDENEYDELTNFKVGGGKVAKKLEPAYPADFIVDLLKITLPLNSSSDSSNAGKIKVIPYASPILKHLISKSLVSDSFVSDGLLNTLLRLNDWDTISKAMEQVTDLSETDLLKILKFIMKQWQSQQSSQAIAPLASLPSLPHLLNAVVQYSYSPVPMRKALRKMLNLDEILVILKCLSTWLEYHTGVNNVSIYSGSKTPPPLESLIKFTSLILDANLIILLQDPTTHEVIVHLAQLITKLREMLGHFKDVNSSLDALTLDSKEKRRLRKMERGKSNRLRAHEASMNIGEYTIEWFDL